ncbi:hypothetical protein [Micromonospora trifolii]|uniref:hypothetical protein n=1 Tax=Micromonospora trifolii TaxID=2911208 RepID=UPI003CE6F77C
MTSLETEAMRKAGQTISEDAKSFADTVLPKIASLTLPRDAFPMFAWNLPDDYERVRQGVGDVAAALQKTMDSIGTALTTIATHYEEQERVRGENFTYQD